MERFFELVLFNYIYANGDDQIGIVKIRLDRILDKYMKLPDQAKALVEHSFLDDKMKRKYLRIVNERISRFIRVPE